MSIFLYLFNHLIRYIVRFIVKKINFIALIVVVSLFVSCIPTESSIEKEYTEIWNDSIDVSTKVDNLEYTNYAALERAAEGVYKRAVAFEKKCRRVDVSTFDDPIYVRNGITMATSLPMTRIFEKYPEDLERYTYSVRRDWDDEDRLKAERLFGLRNRKPVTVDDYSGLKESKRLYIFAGLSDKSYVFPEFLDNGRIPVAYYTDTDTGTRYFPGDSISVNSSISHISATPQYTLTFTDLPIEHSSYNFSVHDSYPVTLTAEDFGEEFLNAVTVSAAKDELSRTFITIPAVPDKVRTKLYEKRYVIREFKMQKERKVTPGKRYSLKTLFDIAYDGSVLKGYTITLEPAFSTF